MIWHAAILALAVSATLVAGACSVGLLRQIYEAARREARGLLQVSSSNELRRECGDSDRERRQERAEDEPIRIADAVFVPRHGQSSRSNTPSVLVQTIGHRMGSALGVVFGTFPAHNVQLRPFAVGARCS
jgi:hypothetical protein